jgi:hypothetical protein
LASWRGVAGSSIIPRSGRIEGEAIWSICTASG